jgi:hypothetical protein
MVATELHAGQQVGAALAARPAAPEIAIEWLLRLIPEAEAKLYGVLTELIPSPSMVMPNLACRQIKMAELAKLANLSRRWVIKLLVRLEERDLIRTQGGRGAAKWIWLLRLGVPRLGKSSPTGLAQKDASPELIAGKAKTPQAAAQPKRRRQEKAQNAKVAPPVEKPAEIPKRRQKAPLPSTPPTDPSSGGPVLARRVPPPPPAAPGNLAVPAAVATPPPATEPASRAAQAAMVTPPPPAAAVMAPPTTPAAQAVQAPPPAAPAAPAKPASRRSIKKIPAVRRPKKKAATIEELVAYIYPQPWPPDLIRNMKVPGMTPRELYFGLQLLCRRPRRYNNRADLVSALRSALNDHSALNAFF